MKTISKLDACQILAINLRSLMNGDQLSEAGIAARAGISQKAVNKILNQKSSATIGTVEKLAHAFGMEAWQMLRP